MSDYNLAPLTEIIAEARRGDLTLVERSALFAAATAFCDRLNGYLDDHHGPDGMSYERDKLTSVMSSLAIVLGFSAFEADKPHAGTWTAIEQDWYTFQGILRP